ncbi:LEUCINE AMINOPEPTIDASE 2 CHLOROPLASTIC-RELATED [Salix koriyanagi]|uniref:LEUCINE AMINOPEPTIDASE 2 CHLOROPLASTIC-RELATED n=1 Tax=Salix koriyanagi TaxID=2511006 RepID=A0A9Q0W2H6_9ROSI|nr:LEUCINE AMINOPEPTIDASE 2 CHLOROPLASTIC-RELATED [Salix koriyanagi]
MAAIAVSLATSLTSAVVPSSLTSFVFNKLNSAPCLRITFSVSRFSSYRGGGKLMAHSLVRATLGLTQPANIDVPKIALSAKEIDVAEWKGDILAVGVTEKDMTKDDSKRFENSLLKNLDAKLGGHLSEASSEEDFTGKPGQSLVLRVPGHGAKRIGLVGLGKSATNAYAFRNFGEAIAAAAKNAQASNVGIVLASTESTSNESKLNIASAIASGTVLGTYEDNRYKSDSKKPVLKSVDILGFGTGPELDKKLKYAEDVSSAVIFGKELVNSPANVLTPAVLAEEATKIASTYSDVFSATILNAEQCKELKMGSYLGVAAASDNPPHFIHLCYKPPSGPIKAKLALVGKGLTFDSGGYNIKTGPGCSIELMKFDMGGSAAVLGAAKAIGQVKPPGVEVHFIVAACENMISGTGMRPGDIVTASNGKTIEVNNTDAEGRLTLADALIYACNQGAEKIIDLATLTGACVVALGPSIAGVFTPSDELANEVFSAAEASGEKLWRMPLEESYWESMKSGVADMVNTGGRQGGAITAALFLKQFVDEKVQWMHIDIAGPVWNEKKRTATGFGIQTLVEWVRQHSS